MFHYLSDKILPYSAGSDVKSVSWFCLCLYVPFYLNKVHDGVSIVYKWLKVFVIIGKLF